MAYPLDKVSITEEGFQLTNFPANQLGLQRGIYGNGSVVVGNEDDVTNSLITVDLSGPTALYDYFRFLQQWYHLGRVDRIKNVPHPAWPLLETLTNYIAYLLHEAQHGREFDERVSHNVNVQLCQAADECEKSPVFKNKIVLSRTDVLAMSDPRADEERQVRLKLGAELNLRKDKFTGRPKTDVSEGGTRATFAKSMYADDIAVFVLHCMVTGKVAVPGTAEQVAFIVAQSKQYILANDIVAMLVHGYSWGYENPFASSANKTLLEYVNEFFPRALQPAPEVITTVVTYEEDLAAVKAAVETA